MGGKGVGVGVRVEICVAVAVRLGGGVRVGLTAGETIPQAEESKPRQATKMA